MSVTGMEVAKGTIRVFLNSAVGNDATGRNVLDEIERNGVDISQVQIFDGQKSGTCVVLVETNTGASRFIVFQGATKSWKFHGSGSVNLMAGGSLPDLIIAHLSVPHDELLQVLEAAHEQGIETILDPSPIGRLDPSVFPKITHLVMNESETALLSECGIHDLHDMVSCRVAAEYFLLLGVKNVIITLGAKGAYFATHVGERGAAILFLGTYAVEYVQQKQKGNWDIKKAVTRACRAAARTIESLGAQESIPWANEIDSE
ncbi:Ribokinase-like protein [Mollisia scopiformis]|uniref:Ribokinase-like protein n=1 Tax=Mollisia scopiformis TaxID=149040 RepID=A0A194WXS4_MOLSC|nr:Ribokinase-like protein [Mollisia scopiformis]KUJ12397.1 Ribokinase-like protein [Mollisia scopiformis]